jgi:hypothetical protein
VFRIPIQINTITGQSYSFSIINYAQALTFPKIINKRSTINETQVFEPWINPDGVAVDQQVLNTTYQALSIAIKKITSEIKILLAMMCMALTKKRCCQRYSYIQEKIFCCYSPTASEE